MPAIDPRIEQAIIDRVQRFERELRRDFPGTDLLAEQFDYVGSRVDKDGNWTVPPKNLSSEEILDRYIAAIESYCDE